MPPLMNPWAPQPATPTQAPGPTMDSQEPNLEQKWQAWMSNPVNRNAMLGAGLQLMMGSWGNQVGNALNAGVQSAAGTEQVMQDQANKDAALGLKQAEIDQRASEGEADRQSRERIADKYVAGRQTVAGMKTPSQLSAYNTAYRTTMQSQELAIMTGELSLDEAQANALAAAEAAAASAQATGAAGGYGALPGQGGPTNGVQQNPGGYTPPGQTGAGGPPGGNGNAPSYYNYADLKRRFGSRPDFEQKLKEFEAAGYKIIGKPGATTVPKK